MRSSPRIARRAAQLELRNGMDIADFEIDSVGLAQVNQQEQRQNKRIHSMRLLLEEEHLDKLQRQAANAGLSVSSYILTCLLGVSTPRTDAAATFDESRQTAWRRRLDRFDDSVAKEGIVLLGPVGQTEQIGTERRRPKSVKLRERLRGALFRRRIVVREKWGRRPIEES
jgi:hypothetical protein